MKPTIRLMVRDWDYLVPLALGDVQSDDFDIKVLRIETVPSDLATNPLYDAGEMSFSRYAQGRARDDMSIVGVPHFLMRAFRHRCIIQRAGAQAGRAFGDAGDIGGQFGASAIMPKRMAQPRLEPT